MAAILADDIFKWIFFNENGLFTIQISLNFVNKCPIDQFDKPHNAPVPYPTMHHL